MVMRSENWPDELEPGLEKMYKNEFAMIEPQRQNLYNMQTSTTSYMKRSGVGALGAVTAHSGTVDYDDMTQKYDKTATHTAYSKGIKIERELADDQLYDSFDDLAKSLGFAFAYRKEEDGATPFNEAFTTSATGGDSLTLCHTGHTSNVPGVSNQGNKGTSAMSPTTVAATRLLGRDFRNDRGQKILWRGNLIVCAPEKEQTAWEIVKTPGKVNTGDNTLNFLKGRYDVLTWDFLTDTNDWFMIDKRYMDMYLVWYDRIMEEFGQDKDSDTFNAKYYGYMRYSYIYYSWEWIYGHQVS